MAGFIGNVPAEKYTALQRQTFSSPTGTSHTLSYSVTNSDDLLLYINNVKQDPADYTASGTSLTTPTLVSGDEMYALFYGRATETVNPPDSSVSSAKIIDGAIVNADINASAGIVASKLDLTSPGAIGSTSAGTVKGSSLETEGHVQFPSTAVASADANALDHYEEGTCTLTLKGSGSDPTTPVTVTATYTRIGNICHLRWNFASVNTTGASGNVSLTGVPFTATGYNTLGGMDNKLFTYATEDTPCINLSSTTIYFNAMNSSGSLGQVDYDSTGTGRYFRGGLTYQIA